MALSGSLNTSSYDGRYYTLSWTATQNQANNTSTISWTLKAAGGSSSWYAERTVEVKIDGAVKYSKSDRVERTAGTVATGTVTLTHDSLGKKSFSVSVRAAVYTSTVNCTGSKSFTLDEIPKGAAITSAPNFTDEDNPVIKYSNVVGNNATSLQACICDVAGQTFYAEYRDISKTGTSYTFNLTTAERNALRAACVNDKSMTVKFYIKTVMNGNTYYSYVSKTLTITNAAPTLSPTVTISTASDTYKLTGSTTKFIKNYTWVNFAFNATAQKGATIKSYKVTCGNLSATSASGILQGAITSSNAEFVVTDSRGYTTKVIKLLDVVDWVKPTVALTASMSPEGKLTLNIEGQYFKGSFGKVTNSLQVGYKYKKEGGSYSSWYYVTPTINTSSYTVNTTVSGLDYTVPYTVQAWVGDALYSNGLNDGIYTDPVTVNSRPVFDWGENDFNFNVPVKIQGAQIADFVVQEGTSGIWTYRKWNSGKAECWGKVRLNTAITTAWGSMYVGTSKMSKQSYPFTFTAQPLEIVNVKSASNAVWVFAESGGNGTNSTTQTGLYNICRPNQITASSNYNIDFYVLGKWK